METELNKLYKKLCKNEYNLERIDCVKLKIELQKLMHEDGDFLLNESLSLGSGVCKACGRPF